MPSSSASRRTSTDGGLWVYIGIVRARFRTPPTPVLLVIYTRRMVSNTKRIPERVRRALHEVASVERREGLCFRGGKPEAGETAPAAGVHVVLEFLHAAPRVGDGCRIE